MYFFYNTLAKSFRILRHYILLLCGGIIVIFRYVIGHRKDVCVYRILGNDLPPRHKNGQTKENLRFMLNNEPLCLGAETKWVVNHIIDKQEENEIISLLQDAGAAYIHLPINFVKLSKLVAQIGGKINVSDLDKPEVKEVVLYITNLNQTRNMCIDDGIKNGFRWILPLDGACIFDSLGWLLFLVSAAWDRERSVLLLSMYRLASNIEFTRFHRKQRIRSEPQVAVSGRDSSIRFDERSLYAQDSKLELVRRILSQCAASEKSSLYAGYIIRLSSGEETSSEDGCIMEQCRKESIVLLINQLIENFRMKEKENYEIS